MIYTILAFYLNLHKSLESMNQVRETNSRFNLIYTILGFYPTLNNSLESTKQVCETHCRSILIYTILAFYLTLHNSLETTKQVRETHSRSILIYTILTSQIFRINETSMRDSLQIHFDSILYLLLIFPDTTLWNQRNKYMRFIVDPF